jgi:hypothetical protein
MSRGLTALRAALGAVGGVTDALQQRELLAEKRRRDEEAAAIQQAQLYSSLGMRAQPYRPASEEQVGVAPASSMDRAALTSALQRGMGVEPPTRDGATTSFQRSVQRGMGVEPTQAGAPLSPLQSAFQKATSGDLASSYTKRTAETPGMRQKLPGGMEVAWQAGPTDEEKRTARLADLRAEKDVELEYQEKTINTERERMRGVYRGAYPTATEQQINGMVNGIRAEDMGLEVLTPSQKKAQARQDSLDALDRQYKLAQIDKLKKDGDSGKPLGPQDLARLSEASSNAVTAGEKMDAIEKDWMARKPNIGALDVGAVQELMEGKGISLNKAVASIWGSAVNPLSTDPETMQQLQDYMSYAKMHSNAIRLIAARGGSNLLQQTEQQLVNAAWAGGQLADIERAQLARNTITESLQDALEASGVSVRLRRAAEQRKFNNNVPGNPLAGRSSVAPNTTRKWPGG